MFPKTNRLPGSSLLPVIKSGRLALSANFTLKTSPSSLPHFRLSLQAPKKLFPLATKRNRLKRRFSAILESLREQIPPQTDLVFTIKSEHFTKEEIAKAL